ncbi:MAG TPA: hypothetical protein VFJ17_06345 [Mycobacteriales bacterium]|jgi:hypothetical protein|nr:hypothetical protein [Mycobacteriales bacterium]
MTELTDREPSRDETEWLVLDEPEPLTPDAPPAQHRAGRRTAFVATGLVAAGALVGGVGVAAFQPSTAASSRTGFPGQLQNGQVPNGQLPGGPLPGGHGLPGQGGFAGGGVDGEQHVNGTVVSVGTSSIRIRTNSGTASYAVTPQTEIVRKGAVASLSAVKAGDSVFVHLVPTGGSSYAVERLFAQSGSSTGSASTSGGSSGSTT